MGVRTSVSNEESVRGTFDVYLEGPMGGIWFWPVAGLAIGLWSRPLARGRSHLPAQRFGSPAPTDCRA